MEKVKVIVGVLILCMMPVFAQGAIEWSDFEGGITTIGEAGWTGSQNAWGSDSAFVWDPEDPTYYYTTPSGDYTVGINMWEDYDAASAWMKKDTGTLAEADTEYTLSYYTATEFYR